MTCPGLHGSSTKGAFVTAPFTGEEMEVGEDGQFSQGTLLLGMELRHRFTSSPLLDCASPSFCKGLTHRPLRLHHLHPPPPFLFQSTRFKVRRQSIRPGLTLPSCRQSHSNPSSKEQAYLSWGRSWTSVRIPESAWHPGNVADGPQHSGDCDFPQH